MLTDEINYEMNLLDVDIHFKYMYISIFFTK